ncbi:uncharacterized protein LOC103100361 [Monodelphis domestica]|uniref:uncharacterized protein LOC103100361 n=1 Tax=Monodelphis domestica TaxID=13616 RepID=UPI0024E21CE4|nr:uncharacterized protein LOC103100361 [Monodelphis domestica]
MAPGRECLGSRLLLILVVVTQGKGYPLNFSLKVLDGPTEPVKVGSLLTLEARVEPVPGHALKIYVDKCFGMQTRVLGQSQRMQSLVFNQGCLLGRVEPLPSWLRQDNETLWFTVPAFMLSDRNKEEKVYIACWLLVWSQKKVVEPGRKMCYYNSLSSRPSWYLQEGSLGNSVCHCCETVCPSLESFHREFPGEGRAHMLLVGPLVVQKAQTFWFEDHCTTLNELIVSGMAFTGSFGMVLMIVLAILGTLVACVRPMCRWPRMTWVRPRESPFQRELVTFEEALDSPVREEEERPAEVERGQS